MAHVELSLIEGARQPAPDQPPPSDRSESAAAEAGGRRRLVRARTGAEPVPEAVPGTQPAPAQTAPSQTAVAQTAPSQTAVAQTTPGQTAPGQTAPGQTAVGGSLGRWAAVVAAAPEPCLVLDAHGVIVAASAACAELIGFTDLTTARGRQLRDAVVNLVDFTDSLDKLDSAEADKIPPLLAISSGRLARGLMRVACPDTHVVATMDAIATPLWEDTTVAGSLTFFARI